MHQFPKLFLFPPLNFSETMYNISNARKESFALTYSLSSSWKESCEKKFLYMGQWENEGGAHSVLTLRREGEMKAAT